MIAILGSEFYYFPNNKMLPKSKLIVIILMVIFACVAAASAGLFFYIRSNKPAVKCSPDMCKAPRGTCSSDNKCVCSTGWSGDNCDVPSKKCDPSACKNGECLNGICKCKDGYGGINCETPCTDDELSIECAGGLQYQCCDKSINSCDDTGTCCPNGLNDKFTCNSGYTCDDKSSLGTCTTTDRTECPPQWCPSQTFKLCDDILEKNKMYIIINQGVLSGLKGVKQDYGGKINDSIAAVWDVGTLGTTLSGGQPSLTAADGVFEAVQGSNSLLRMPQYLNLSSRKEKAPKDPSESYLYIDDSRPNCVCITGDDPNLCQPADDESGGSLSLQCADSANLWSLQKFKYKQFYPNRPNSLLYQIATGFIKSYQCQMTQLKIPSYCLGMGPRNTPFPSESKVGNFFRFIDLSKPNDPKANHLMFPKLPTTSDYGDWKTGVPWVELENAPCGGLCAKDAQCTDTVKSKLRNRNTLDSGCFYKDDGKEACGAPSDRANGYYMFVRVANPDTGKFYRFYLGTPQNWDASDAPAPEFADEYGNSLGVKWDNMKGFTYPAGIRPETLFFFTEDVPYGLEKYISASNGTANPPMGSGGGGVFPGKTAAIDLFIWQFSEILPLPPQGSWQTNTMDAMPYCHLPACGLDSTFWLDKDQRCHNISAELAPNLPWGTEPGQIAKPGGADVPQGVPQSGNTYYSTCDAKTGRLPKNPTVCDLSQLSSTELASIKTDCNNSSRNFCGSGIKYVSAQRCGAFKAPEPTGVPFTSLYTVASDKSCIANTDPSPSPAQVFPTNLCSPDYACDKFGNLNSFGGK